MNNIQKVLIIGLVFLLNHCVQLHSISINSQPAPAERVKPIEAIASKLVFLAFNFNNDFLEEAPKKLREQCTNGKIKGIVTKFETVSYFIFIDYVVRVSGYCVK